MTLRENFGAAASLAPTSVAKTKRIPPFSLRLTEAERERLIAESGGAPLGTYIKAKILGGVPPVRMRRSGLVIEDRKALAQLVAAFGASRMASNLNQLAHLANIGALIVNPEIEAELSAAYQDIREMRRLLLLALGLKPGDAP